MPYIRKKIGRTNPNVSGAAKEDETENYDSFIIK